MVLTCFQCQGPSLHLQCQQDIVPGPPARFVSVNGACSWTSLHLPFVNENRPYRLVTDALYNSSTHEHHGVHSSSPHYTPSPESPFGTPVFGILQWDWKLARYGHTAVCQAGLVQGICLWVGGTREMESFSFPLEISFFFVSHYLSLHSGFKFRQIPHWLLKCSVHCKTRLSCSDTPSHLLQHAQPCF